MSVAVLHVNMVSAWKATPNTTVYLWGGMDGDIVWGRYSLNKKEWICSLFKEWILEKSEIRVNLEWTFVLFTHFGVTTGITQGFRVIPEVTPKWVNNTNVHSNSLQIHSNFTLF